MDKYKIEGIIGKGAYGEVFEAMNTDTNERVAIKKIHLNDNVVTEKLIQEGNLQQELIHQNVVRLYEHCEHNGYYCYVLEYVSECLAKVIRDYTNKPVILKSLMKQLLQGLAYCHRRGIMHRDIKPDNLLLDLTNDSHPILKLADFGLSRENIGSDLSPDVATAGYRAPEILLGSDSYTCAVDIWSAGCTFGELVKGKQLFQMKSHIPLLTASNTGISYPQLFDIFSMRGMPDEDTWPNVTSLPGFNDIKYSPSMTSLSPENLEDTFSNLSPSGIDLLDKMLCLDPSQRITAAEALDHDYFKE